MDEGGGTAAIIPREYRFGEGVSSFPEPSSCECYLVIDAGGVMSLMNFSYVGFTPVTWPNVTMPSVVSPLPSILKLPRMPSLIFRLKRCDETDARVPSDAAMAPSSTCAACAA